MKIKTVNVVGGERDVFVYFYGRHYYYYCTSENGNGTFM